MKSNLKKGLFVLFIGVIVCSFFSCSKDDNRVSIPVNASSLSGNWKLGNANIKIDGLTPKEFFKKNHPNISDDKMYKMIKEIKGMVCPSELSFTKNAVKTKLNGKEYNNNWMLKDNELSITPLDDQGKPISDDLVESSVKMTSSSLDLNSSQIVSFFSIK